MEPVEVLISERWRILLPPHRARLDWNTWEKARLISMHENIGAGDIVYDIGSEEGDMSGLYAKWGAIVIPFEPNPHVWPNPRFVWEANNLERPPAYFVGFAANKTILRPPEIEPIFLLPRKNGWPGCAYGEVIGDHGFRNETERSHDTPSIKIDDFRVMSGLPPDVITMDVEGAELEVLRGAEAVLRSSKPLVYVSIHPDFMMDKYGYGKQQLLDFMESYGYSGNLMENIHEEHWLFIPNI